MENAPLYEASDSDDSDSRKARKRAGSLLSRTVKAESSREERPAEPGGERRGRGWLNLSNRELQSPKPEPAAVVEAMRSSAHGASKSEKTGGEHTGAEENRTAETGESAADAEVISDSEKAVVLEMVARARQAEAASDPNAAPEEQAGDLAADQMYELIGEHEDPDAAYETVLRQLGVDPAAEHIIEADESLPDEEVGEEVPSELAAEADEVVFDRSRERFDEHPAEDEDNAGTAATAPAGTAAAAGTAGGGAVPPLPPRATPGGGPGFGGGGYGPVPPFGPGGGGPGVGGGPGGFANAANLFPNPNAANAAPVAPAEQLDAGNPAAAALLGGIIGYLIGRRRGRIKTEKKLLPIQKKLEKQVEDMKWEVYRKEDSLRKIAAEQVRQKGPVVVERLEKAAPSIRRIETVDASRRAAPEARQLHAEKPAPERIGHVLISAEAPIAARVAGKPVEAAGREDLRHVNQKAEAVTLPPERRVETMSRSELLQLSEKIVVEGSSLRQIYETHLVGEQGLRRLITEHLRGGDIKKALKREIVEHEIDFERDPAMRDVSPGAGPIATGGGKTALNQMVERASAQVVGAHDEIAYYKARNNYHAQQEAQERRQRRLVDVTLGTIIVTLLTLVIVLYVARG